ncbi:MAG: hypothetical protein WAZ18_05755 [Alphaproteobacteria bacterium]
MTQKAYQLQGEERNEIERLVMRIKRADDKVHKPTTKPALAEQDVEWAEANRLPREFFEFFELQRVA